MIQQVDTRIMQNASICCISHCFNVSVERNSQPQESVQRLLVFKCFEELQIFNSWKVTLILSQSLGLMTQALRHVRNSTPVLFASAEENRYVSSIIYYKLTSSVLLPTFRHS